MGSVSRPSTCCASSTGSSAPCPPAITADSDWAFTSPGGSWKRTAERLKSTAHPAWAPPSPSTCRLARDERRVPEIRKRDPVLSGVPLSLSTRCVLSGSDCLLPQAACDSVLGLLAEPLHSLHLHLDLLRLDLRLLGEPDAQHAIAAFSGGVLGLHRRRHREGATERTVVPLDAVVHLALVGLLQPAIAAQRERVALDLDFHVLCLYLGQLHFQRDPLGVLEDVDLRRPGPGHGDLRLDVAAAEAVRLIERAEDAVLQLQQLTVRVVTHDGHQGLPCRVPRRLRERKTQGLWARSHPAALTASRRSTRRGTSTRRGRRAVGVPYL